MDIWYNNILSSHTHWMYRSSLFLSSKSSLPEIHLQLSWGYLCACPAFLLCDSSIMLFNGIKQRGSISCLSVELYNCPLVCCPGIAYLCVLFCFMHQILNPHLLLNPFSSRGTSYVWLSILCLEALWCNLLSQCCGKWWHFSFISMIRGMGWSFFTMQ